MVYDCSGFRPAKWVPKDTNSKEKNCKLGCAGIPVDQLRMRQWISCSWALYNSQQFTTWKQLADPTDDNRKFMICQRSDFPYPHKIYIRRSGTEVGGMNANDSISVWHTPSFQSNWEGKPKASKGWNLTENNPWWKGGGNRWETYLRSICKENKAWIHEV